MPKTYTEEEVRELLHQALQFQEEALERERKEEGLTIDEISEIAEEVGIDSAFIAMAAEAREEEDAFEQKKGVLGRTKEIILRRSVEGELTVDNTELIVNRLRRVSGVRGTTSKTPGHLEWEGQKSDGEHVKAVFSSQHGETESELALSPKRRSFTEWLPALMPLVFPLVILFAGGPFFAFAIFLIFASFMAATAFGAVRKSVGKENQREQRKAEGLLSGIEGILKAGEIQSTEPESEKKSEGRIDNALLDEEAPLNQAPNVTRGKVRREGA